MHTAGASVSDVGMVWVCETERGVRALLRGNAGVASAHWSRAHGLARQFNETDPRRACGLNNLALAGQLDGDLQDARQNYELANEQWHKARNWVESMQVQRRSRSSLHHLRLEARHRALYDRPHRERQLRVLLTGEVVTLVNLAQCLALLQETEKARSLRAQAETLLTGLEQENEVTTDPECRRLRASLDCKEMPGPGSGRSAAAPAHFGKFSEIAIVKRWVIDQPAELTDEGCLMAAVQLAGVVAVIERKMN